LFDLREYPAFSILSSATSKYCVSAYASASAYVSA